MGEFAIGQRVPRFEDPRLVRGGGRYIDDMQIPGMAYGRCCARRTRTPRSIRSTPRRPRPRPACSRHDRRRLEGRGLRRTALAWRPQAPRRPAGYKPRYPVLAEDRVRWVGDPRRLRGRRKLAPGGRTPPNWSQVDYAPLPAVLSTAEATKSGVRASRTTAEQYRFRGIARRQGRDRCRVARPPTSSSIVSSSPRHRRRMEPRGASALRAGGGVATPILAELQRAHGSRRTRENR